MDPSENPTQEKTITPEMIPAKDDRLLIDPNMFWRIINYSGRYIPRTMHTVAYAIRENAIGPIWSARDFHHLTDAQVFTAMVREAGGLAEEPKESKV